VSPKAVIKARMMSYMLSGGEINEMVELDAFAQVTAPEGGNGGSEEMEEMRKWRK
jgi:hypothetical protein